MTTFKDFLIEETESKETFCYMLYLPKEEIQKVKDLQKSLNIKADELQKDDDFHCTIRYVKLKNNQNSEAFIEYLNSFVLPTITATTYKFSSFKDETLVAELESQELHDWFSKIDGWLTSHKYNKSDFPTFKPHISLAYGLKGELPKFDPEKHRLKLKFKVHIVTNSNRKKIFEKSI